MKDLKLVGYDKKQGAPKWEHIVCGTCIKPEEDSVRFRKSLLIESSWFRALETELRKKLAGVKAVFSLKSNPVVLRDFFHGWAWRNLRVPVPTGSSPTPVGA